MNPSETTCKKPASAAIENIRDYERLPLAQRFPIDNTYTLIQEKTLLSKSSPAMRQFYTAQKDECPKEMHFHQLTCAITQTANLLHDAGVGRTDCVTILLPSLMENQIALWGSQAAGIANPVNHFLDTGHITDIMNRVKSKVLITLAPGDTIGLQPKVAELIKNVPSLTHVFLVRDTPDGSIDTQTFCHPGIQVLDFLQTLEKQPDDRLKHGQAIKGSDTAIYFHTGGTTGKPKIAVLTHSSVAFVAQVYADYNHHHGPSAVLNPLPLFHVFGTIAASLAVFIQGRCVILMTPAGFRNPNVVKNWWFFVEKYQVAWFATVPTIISALLKNPPRNENIDCLKFINSGSAPLPVELKKTCARQFNAEVVSGYGMTESSCLIARCLNGYETPEDTVGVRIPYTQVITAIVKDRSIQRICDPGEPGEVLVKGPNLFKGYLDPAENAGAWVDGHWFNTGDIGVLDENSYLRLTGRAKDLIIRGGHNIDPQTIEVPLERHPAIAQAVAVGQPDAYAGEVPVAYVCLKDAANVTEAQLLEYCSTHVSERPAVPKRIEVIHDMPLTAVGKISKPALRNRATEFAVDQALTRAGIIPVRLQAAHTLESGQVIHIQLHSETDRTTAHDILKGFPMTVEIQVSTARTGQR